MLVLFHAPEALGSSSYALEVTAVKAAISSLPGVQDEGQLDAAAAGIVSASAEATCTLDWKRADWCRPIWPTSRHSLQAALITAGYFESRWLARIGRGECRKNECDAYKFRGRIYHRARGYYQIQRSGLVSSREWVEMLGTNEGATFVASAVSARILARNYSYCRTYSGMFSGYARGGNCQWKGAGLRSRFMEKIAMPRLQAARAVAGSPPRREVVAEN